jgi:hypothetical protein
MDANALLPPPPGSNDEILPNPYDFSMQMSDPRHASAALAMLYGKRELAAMLEKDPAWHAYLAARTQPLSDAGKLAVLCEFMGEFVDTWAHGPNAMLVPATTTSGGALHNVKPIGISSTGIAVVVGAVQEGGPLALYMHDLEKSGALAGSVDRLEYNRCSISVEGNTLVSLCGDFVSVYYPGNAALLCYTLKHRASTATDALCGVFTLPDSLQREGYAVLQAVSNAHTAAFIVRRMFHANNAAAPTAAAAAPECVFGTAQLMVHLTEIGPHSCNVDVPVHPYTGTKMPDLVGLGTPTAAADYDKRELAQQPCYATYDELTPNTLAIGTMQGCVFVVQLTDSAAATRESLVTAGPAIVQVGTSAEMDMRSRSKIHNWPGLEPVELMRCRGLELSEKPIVVGGGSAGSAGVCVVSDGRIFAKMPHSISFRAPGIVPDESVNGNNTFVLSANLCYSACQQRDLTLALVDLAMWGSLLVTYDGAGFVRLGSSSPTQTGSSAMGVESSWLAHIKIPVPAASGSYRAIYCAPTVCFVMMPGGAVLKLCKK